MTLEELQAAALAIREEEKALAARRAELVKFALIEARSIVGEFALDTVAVFGRPASKPVPKVERAAKYKDPISGKTWTGLGRPPHWAASVVDGGGSLDDLLITKPSSARALAPHDPYAHNRDYITDVVPK